MRALRPMLVLALALLAGCNQSGRPATTSALPPPPVETVAAPPAPAVPATYVVAPGDTVYGLARRFGVDRHALIRANNLTPPYKLLVGQRLMLPPPPAEMAQPAAVAPGEMTTPPAPAQTTAPAAGSGAITATPLAPLPGVGGKPASPPASIAPLPAPAAVPPTVQPAAPPADTSPQLAPLPTAPAPQSSASGPPLPLGKAPPPEDSIGQAAKPPAAGKPAEPEPKALSGAKFLWPVEGKVVAGFGSIANGLHNDGLNIAAPEGTPVRAAENGVVAYSGNELKGFGNLLLVRHANGWMSAYAHNESLLVKRGDTVKRGEVIAKVGATGNVSSPQLHFELRHNTEAVDPEKYLGS